MNANNRNFLVLIGVLIALILVAFSSAFTVNEAQQALVLRFGKVVTEEPLAPGLHFKYPFIETVDFFERRVLTWDDSAPDQVPTRDQKYITIDTTARWKIVDPRLFRVTIYNNIDIANTRLDGIIGSATRDVISSHNLVESIRNTNTILDTIKQRQADYEKKLEEVKSEELVTEIDIQEITGDVERIETGREVIEGMIMEKASPELKRLGMELIDVQIRRIMYEESVQQKVYERMISERQRIAERIRSYGKKERQNILGKINQERQEINGNAYKTVQEVLGKAEAEAAAIYADSINQAPAFYELQRKLNIYEKGIATRKSTFVLSTDNPMIDVIEGKGLK